MGFRRKRSRLLEVLVIGLAAVLAAPPPAARADEFVNKVNAAFKNVPNDKRSELILIPAMMKLEAPPAEVDALSKAILLLPTSSGWESAVNWAQAQPQKDMLQALTTVTKEEDYHIAMVFAQGYGVEEVADHPDWIAAEMYSELGDPPTLAMAKIGYLPKLKHIHILANVEAARQMNEGNFVGALDTMFDFLYFARQIADRPMLAEKGEGMAAMLHSLERIRDIVYQDQRASAHKLTYKELRSYVERLEEEKGYVGIDRLTMPTGQFVAADQLVHRVMVERKGVNEATFGVTMARVASAERPLRLFSESAYWDTVGASHEGYFATRDMLLGKKPDQELGGLAYDWTKRWNLGPHDAYSKLESDFQRHVAKGPRFAMLRTVLNGVEALFPIKTGLKAEVAGTRMALAIYGFYRENNSSFPPDISAIRPKFVSAVDNDPYSAARRPLGYFVPIRDNIPRQDPRRDPQPWTINCFPTSGPYANFTIPLRQDTFVLFSVGPDNSSVNSKDATQEAKNVEGDYLLWPPMMSLIRQNLIDRGELK